MTIRRRLAPLLAVMTVAVCPWILPVHPENIDPSAIGSRFVWGENIGWVNAEALGDGGPGVQVDDFELTGWMWGENIGWVSLSCKNTGTCDLAPYGVSNDGHGVLTGFGWAENAGWINFSPSTAGVWIDPATGIFEGHAWGENIGWIVFRSTGPNPFVLETAWRCDPAPPPPADPPTLWLERPGAETVLSWTAVIGATGYDVVQGDLGILRAPGGGFVPGTTQCLAENLTDLAMVHPQSPTVGEGFWYLVRAVNCGDKGSYDSGQPSQVAPRDADIAASGNDCRVP